MNQNKDTVHEIVAREDTPENRAADAMAEQDLAEEIATGAEFDVLADARPCGVVRDGKEMTMVPLEDVLKLVDKYQYLVALQAANKEVLETAEKRLDHYRKLEPTIRAMSEHMDVLVDAIS